MENKTLDAGWLHVALIIAAELTLAAYLIWNGLPGVGDGLRAMLFGD